MPKFKTYTQIDSFADADVIVVLDDSASATKYGTMQQLGDYVDSDQGFVTGPSSATDNAVVRYDATTGKLVQNSAVIIDDSNNITGVATLTATGAITVDTGATYGIGSGLLLGDGDTGFYEVSDDELHVQVAGAKTWIMSGGRFGNAAGNKAQFLNEVSSATNPGMVPSQSDLDTGVGWAAADQLSLIAGGVEGIRITEAGSAITAVDINGPTNVTGALTAVTALDGVTITAKSEQNDSSHSTTTPFGSFVVYSNDGSGAGAGVRGGLRVYPASTSGGTAATVITAYDGTGEIEVARFGNDKKVTLAGDLALSAGQIISFAGVVGTPGLTMAGDEDTGWYSPGGGRWAFADNGAKIFEIGGSETTSGAISASNSAGAMITNESASSTNPTIHARRNDLNTGIGSAGADQLSLITGGTEAVGIDASQNVTLSADLTTQAVTLSGSADVLLKLLGNTTGGGSIEFHNATTGGLAAIEVDNNQALAFSAGGVGNSTMRLNAGTLYLNDSANANMTVGLTINQGANDDEIFSLKSSDINHGISSITETDTYAKAEKWGGADGGLIITGLSEAAGGFMVKTYTTTNNTTKTSGGRAATEIRNYKKSGTTGGAMDSNANLFAVADQASLRFIIDAEGDFHYDGVDGGAFDEYDDVSLVRAFAHATSDPRQIIKNKWDEYVSYNEQSLVDLGILGAPISQGGLVNGAQLQRLHTGAIWQIGSQMMDQQEQIEDLSRQLVESQAHIKQLMA